MKEKITDQLSMQDFIVNHNGLEMGVNNDKI